MCRSKLFQCMSYCTGIVTALLCVSLFVGTASAHQRLERSEPAADARLEVVPTELRLTFSQPVGIDLTRIELIGPEGTPVALGRARVGEDAANVVVVAVSGRLAAGAYEVAWRTVGPDGHPVDGSFAFTIAEGAAGLMPPEPEPVPDGIAAPDPVASPVASPLAGAERSVHTASYSVDAPSYVAIRWFTYLCLLGLVGVVVFRVVVLRLVAKSQSDVAAALSARSAARARAIGMAIAVVLVPAALLRLAAQGFAVAGGAPDAATIAAILGGAAWGWGWWLQTTATVAALLGLWISGRRERQGWTIATVATALLSFTPALSGHAIAVVDGAPFAVAADALHVMGAGGWLGTLALVVAAGLPATRPLSDGERGRAVDALVGAFSPVALSFAGVLVATGVYASWLHLGGVEALWSSAYGRALSVKLGALALVFGMGAYNFLRVRPSLGDASESTRIRRTSLVELTVGVLVLVITAVLVATPPAVEADPAVDPQASVETSR